MADVVLIEDDAWLADLYCDVLEDAGHHVRVAPTAHAAVELIDSQPPRVIVLDLMLPMHSGVQILHELQASAEMAEIPVVIHSAVDPAQNGLSEKDWRAYGVMAYVHKTTSRPHDLVRTVSRITGEKQ